MKNKIKKLRKEKGLRQEDLAELLGVTRQTIIAVENDKYNPTLELAMKMAKLLEVSVEDLFQMEAPVSTKQMKKQQKEELRMKNEKAVVNNFPELLEALQHKVSEITVKGELVEKMRILKKAQLSDTERMGSDLGSSGVLSVAEYGLNKIFGSFKGETKEETKINEKISNLYSITISTPDTAELRLKQLDY